MAAAPSRSAHSLTDAQRKELLSRLIQERQARPGLDSAASTESLAEKRERVQQLLRERRSSQGKLPVCSLAWHVLHRVPRLCLPHTELSCVCKLPVRFEVQSRFLQLLLLAKKA